MKRIVFLALCLNSLLLSTASAGTDDYDFSGTLTDHFVPLFPNPNSTITQNDVADQLEYSAPGGDLSEENGTGVEHINFQPRYDQSWRAGVDVTLPASYDSSFLATNPANPNNDNDTWIELGILAFTSFDDMEVFSSALELILDGAGVIRRNVSSHHDINGASNRVPTTAVSTRLTLEFNSNSKVLDAYAGNTLLHSANISDAGSDWQMSDDDTFRIAIFGSTGYQEVTADNPLIHDNFTAQIVPEPSALALALLAIACLRPLRSARA